MHKLKTIISFACLVSLACGHKGPVTSQVATSDISAKALGTHVGVLASDEFEGRGLDTAGIEKAAGYIAEQFAKAGLKPAGDNWFQPFDMTVGMDISAGNHLSTKIPTAALSGTVKPGAFRNKKFAKSTIDWTTRNMWSPVGLSESGTADATVVFAGYGITAPEFEYDDYKGVDVKGKIVLLMRFAPGDNDPNSPFSGRHASRYGSLRYKAINAREKGAVGVLFVTPWIGHEGPDDLVGVEKDFTSKGSLIAAHVKREVAERLLAGSGIELRAVQKKIDDDGKPQSRTLHASAKIQIQLTPRTKPAKNVIGVLKGSDPKLSDQVVVVGAHYDHLGLGTLGSSLDPDRIGQVHNGADDNASGTAALMEIARAFGRTEPAPKRTMVFIAFSAEESGLGGSSHYVKNPLFPIAKTVAMLNMDMIGRMRENKVHAFGSETAEEFAALLKKVNEESLTLDAHGDGYGPSDHTPFFSQNIPVLHFFTGAHAQYHKTSDDSNMINSEGLAKVSRLVARSAFAISNTTAKPTFQRPTTNPHASVGRRGPGASRGYGAYFGSIPDFTERKAPGVRLTGVREGSPAAKAGVKAGDVLVEFGGVEIKNLYDFTFALRQHKPGDEVAVKVQRAGSQKTLQVTLGKRGS